MFFVSLLHSEHLKAKINCVFITQIYAFGFSHAGFMDCCCIHSCLFNKENNCFILLRPGKLWPHSDNSTVSPHYIRKENCIRVHCSRNEWDEMELCVVANGNFATWTHSIYRIRNCNIKENHQTIYKIK